MISGNLVEIDASDYHSQHLTRKIGDKSKYNNQAIIITDLYYLSDIPPC